MRQENLIVYESEDIREKNPNFAIHNLNLRLRIWTTI